MKNAFTSTLALTIVGLAVLVAGALYFGAPLFGWVIMAAIFLVFVIEQVQSLKIMKQIAVESLVLDDCERRDSFNVTQEGIVQKRFELARKLLANNIRLDSPMAYEVMSNSVSVSIPRGAGGTVILLGLMGTFFGLMYSVATAGGAIDNSTTQGTLDTIQMLFQGMKGIFGTSLCGLFAALILNGTRTMLIASRERFVSRLDVMTLNLQGSATGEFEQNKNDLERLFDSVEKSLSDVSAAVQSGLSEVVRKVGDNMSSALQEMSVKVNDSVEKISQSMQNIGGAVTESLSGAFAPMEASVKNLAVIVEGIPSKLDEKLKGMTSSLQSGLEGVANATRGTMEGISKDITSSVVEQVKKSEEQWNGFMARLEAETSSSVEAQRSGLESLKDVALQVAEKAQAGSAELSQ